ncbi:hypothetical protein [Actinophytocola glycyrrhizae]|uniref:DUF3311 domain-containing protein n=1 Tax=Actinophytocola glycyrrhizae TaxID=2044873 RepID=A0ABV9RVA1_9PSEU
MNDRRRLAGPRVGYGLVVLCGLVFVADFFLAKHPHFAFEGWFGFYPVYGFAASVALVLTAKELRRVLRRDEDYYERPERNRDDE